VAAFVLKRVMWAFMLALLISFLTFVLFFIIPDEARVARSGNADQLVSLARQYDVEGQSIWQQYGTFVWRFVRHGDLGQSFVNRQPVMEQLASALPVTMALIAGGALLWLLMAFPIGILSALRPRSLLDRIAMVFVLVGVSAHPVWIGLILSYFLGYQLHVTPIAGYCDFFNPSLECGGALDWAYHMFLPWLTFAFLFTALYTRMIRAMVLETLQEDYVRTALAKGAGPIRILRSHVLRNALLPLVTMVGMDVGIAFGGALFIESVYDLPGVGGMLYDAITRLDLPVIMGVFLVVSLTVVVANLFADIACMVLDPRMHVSRISSYGKEQRPRLPSTGFGRASAPTPAQSASAASPQ
jgi:peptide/nickel transport system permease protein